MGETQDLSWAAGKKYMGNVDAFLKSLLAFDKDNVPVVCCDRVEKDYLSNPAFNADNIRTKSGAAAGLCAWVINICKYFRIYQVATHVASALRCLLSDTRHAYGVLDIMGATCWAAGCCTQASSAGRGKP